MFNPTRRIVLTLLVLGAALLAAAPHVRAGAQSAAPADAQAEGVWDPQYYYLDPRPDTMFENILGLLAQEPLPFEDRCRAVVAMGILFEQHPHRTSEWVLALDVIPDANKPAIWHALAAASTDEATMALDQIKTDDPGKEPTINHLLAAPPRDLIGEVVRTPNQIAELWAAFYMTGDDLYVRKLIQTLEWSTPDELDQRRSLVGGAAYWSLAQNAHAHSRVLRLCRESLATTENERVRRSLAGVIDEAERALAQRPCPEPRFDDEH